MKCFFYNFIHIAIKRSYCNKAKLNCLDMRFACDYENGIGIEQTKKKHQPNVLRQIEFRFCIDIMKMKHTIKM